MNYVLPGKRQVQLQDPSTLRLNTETFFWVDNDQQPGVLKAESGSRSLRPLFNNTYRASALLLEHQYNQQRAASLVVMLFFGPLACSFRFF